MSKKFSIYGKIDNMSEEEYELYHKKLGVLWNDISNLQLLFTHIGNSNVCPYCRSKIDVEALKILYNEEKKRYNKLSPDVQFSDVE